MAYARAARAVRYSIVLQSKLTADLETLETDAAEAREEAEELALLQTPDSVRRAAVEHIIESVVRADREPGEGSAALNDRIEHLTAETADRLEIEELYGDILARPISEVVAELCRDLGLHPDWPVLAETAWAKREIESGRAGAPLRASLGGDAISPAGGGGGEPRSGGGGGLNPQPFGADAVIPIPDPVIPKPMPDPPPDGPAPPSEEPPNLLS
jgi:hypothetical protein